MWTSFIKYTIPSFLLSYLIMNQMVQTSCSSKTLKSCTYSFSYYLSVYRSDDAVRGDIHRCVPQAVCSQVEVEMHIFFPLLSPWGHKIGQHHKMEWGPLSLTSFSLKLATAKSKPQTFSDRRQRWCKDIESWMGSMQNGKEKQDP